MRSISKLLEYHKLILVIKVYY